MDKKKLSLFNRYLAKEIGVELKTCLYFFCILFFYSVYKLIGGSIQASIIHMGEMILVTYVMVCVQVYFLSNFDEAEDLKAKEIICIILCSLVYSFVALWGSWFDKSIGVGIVFFIYMILAYISVFFVYKFKRNIDEKILNEDLKRFQERRMKDEECDRN